MMMQVPEVPAVRARRVDMPADAVFPEILPESMSTRS